MQFVSKPSGFWALVLFTPTISIYGSNAGYYLISEHVQ